MTTRTRLRLLDAGMGVAMAGLAVMVVLPWAGFALILVGFALIAPMFARVKIEPVEREDGSTLTCLTRDPAWWSLPGVGLSEEAQASRRWTENNARAKAAGCHCGKPATRVRLDHRNVGWVPVETWTCDEHVGVEAWFGTTPRWTRTTRCDDCPVGGGCSSSGPIGGPPTKYYCATREGDESL